MDKQIFSNGRIKKSCSNLKGYFFDGAAEFLRPEGGVGRVEKWVLASDQRLEIRESLLAGHALLGGGVQFALDVRDSGLGLSGPGGRRLPVRVVRERLRDGRPLREWSDGFLVEQTGQFYGALLQDFVLQRVLKFAIHAHAVKNFIGEIKSTAWANKNTF